jgi:hypothetical protein
MLFDVKKTPCDFNIREKNNFGISSHAEKTKDLVII